ncbi:Ribonuclease H-like domain [Cinara cedri]|uniref:Ribonuclease H-like domain n=1 Tax=Cinara cedri TaxID=506608 RepID=A0A5E4NMW8_9HEMI|nr:Ribonuclease H-like domain [Cinara cedri]
MLKYTIYINYITKISLELLTDYDMLLMFERGYAVDWCRRVNDTRRQTIILWKIKTRQKKIHGLYTRIYMPHGGFKWMEPTLNGLEDLDDTSPIGRVYEVDIEYPENVHEDHNDLSFFPNNEVPPGSKMKKLMATLKEKNNCIIHYRNLKQATANRLIVKKATPSPSGLLICSDTCRFMTSSLESLASDLITTKYEKSHETRKKFNNEDIPLVTRKIMYPCEYTDSWGKLEEDTLPETEDFYSTLKEENVEDDEYGKFGTIFDAGQDVGIVQRLVFED